MTLTRIRQTEAEARDQYDRQAGLVVAGVCAFISAAGCWLAWLALCSPSF